MSHGHSHCCGHEHDHDDASDADRGSQFSLYTKIDTERVECLNEMIEGSGKFVFKAWDQRLDTTQVLISHIIARVNIADSSITMPYPRKSQRS